MKKNNTKKGKVKKEEKMPDLSYNDRELNITYYEKITIARGRRGLDRRRLGELVYNKKNNIKVQEYNGKKYSPENRIRRIEIGLVKFKNLYPNELKTIANCLGYPESELSDDIKNRLTLNFLFKEKFPKIDEYIDMLNSSIFIDTEMCVAIFKRIGEYIEEIIKEEKTVQSSKN